MNVGVWIAGYDPEDGGGYTFESDVLESLATLAGESTHAFTVLSTETRGVHTRSPCAGQLRFVSVRQPSIFERTTRHLAEDFGLFRRVLRRPSQIESVARALDIEFIWSVSPAVHRLDLPYLMTVWDLQHRVQPWFPEVTNGGVWRDREAVYSWSLRRAAAVIVGTEAGRGEVERFYQVPSDRVWILPHPTPKFALELSETGGKHLLEKYGIPQGYLLYPAAFWPHKNHVNLLYAARRLRDEDRLLFPLVFTGADKGNRAHVHRVAVELGLDDQVHFVGFVSREELAALYRNAYALTYVSFFGPENLPPLEAFALGCPVIASDVAGAREQLEDAALFADPSRPEQIAHAIKLLQDASLRRTLVERGCARAARWTARDFVKGVFSILDRFEATRRCWGR